MPSIIGEARKEVKVGVLLLLHSPYEIYDVMRNIIRGTIKITMLGDTTTGKSVIVSDLTFNHYNFGDYIAGEATSRTGLTYSIDTERRALIWGALVLNDRGMICLDGLQDLPPYEFDKLTEALRIERIVVTRYVRGEALARTRVIATMNPKRGHPIDSYPYPCMAIADNQIFNKEKNITRWDLFLPLFDEDVPTSEIVKAQPSKRPIPKDVFIRHVYWIWSRKAEDILWTDEARKTLINGIQKLMKAMKATGLPIVHNAYRDTLSRLSVACAGLRNSTDSTHEKIIVRAEDVVWVGRYVTSVLRRLKIHKYKELFEKSKKLEPDDLLSMLGDLDAFDFHILTLLLIKPHSSKELSKAIQMGEVSIRKTHFSRLKNWELIETMPGKGAVLTSKAKQLFKVLEVMDIDKKEARDTA